MERKSQTSRKSKTARKSQTARKSKTARKSTTARKSSVRGSKRKSSLGSNAGKGGHRKSSGKDKKKHPMTQIKEHLSSPENMAMYWKFFKELMEKKENLVKDCIHGRKRFVDWLATFLRGEGLVVEVREMEANPLSIYGPEGPPKAVLAYPVDPHPELWTLCIFGRYEQKEEQTKDPAILFNGKICYRKRPPETWNILACWLATFKALSNAKQPLPVNVKMCFTALQTDDAPALVRFINSIRREFLRNVDFFVHATTLSVTTLPGGIAYSGRGVCNFVMEINDGTTALEKSATLSSDDGPVEKAVHEMIHFVTNIEKDSLYTYLHMFEDFVVPYRLMKLVRRMFVRDLAPISSYFHRKKILEIKENWANKMWKPVITVQTIEGFSELPDGPPTRFVLRFSVKYMTEASPAQVEEMVNRMLCKKWAMLNSQLTCRLSMDYWARPWYAVNKNRLYRPVKKSAKRAFHRCPTEAFDFAPNALPAVLQRLLPHDFCMIILASMPNMKHHQFCKNLKRNMKMLISFLYEIGKAKTEKAFSVKWNKWRGKTRPYRLRWRKMEKRWRPPIDPDHPEEEPGPVPPPESFEPKTSDSKRSSSKPPRKSNLSGKRKSTSGRKSTSARKSKSIKRKSRA